MKGSISIGSIDAKHRKKGRKKKILRDTATVQINK
jgi:hypothetical protein